MDENKTEDNRIEHYISEIIKDKMTYTAISSVTKYIEGIFSTITDGTKNDFVFTSLPRLFESINKSENNTQRIIQEIILFNRYYIQITIHFGFQVNLLRVMGILFDKSMRKVTIYEPTRQSYRSLDLINKLPDGVSLLLKNRPKIHIISDSFIENIYEYNFFTSIRDFIEQKQMSLLQFRYIIDVFLGMESSINEKVVFSVINILSDNAIDLIIHTKDFDNDVCSFLVMFAKMLPKKVSSIINCFSVLIPISSIQIQIQLLTYSQTVLSNNNYEGQFESFKDCIIELVKISKNHELLMIIFDVLPNLATNTPISSEDLSAILFSSHSFHEERALCISKMIPYVSDNMDLFAQRFLDSKFSSPLILLQLINQVNDLPLIDLIFSKFLLSDQVQNKYDISQLSTSKKIDNVILEKISTANSYFELSNLSYFFLNHPKSSQLPLFFEKIDSLLFKNPDLIELLTRFKLVLKQFNSRKIFWSFFEKIMDNMGISGMTEYLDGIINLLFEWLLASESFPFVKMVDRLLEKDQLFITDSFPKLLNIIIEKCPSHNKCIELLFKVFKSYIQSKHSHWLVHSLFDRIHDDLKGINVYCSILSELLNGEGSFESGVSHLYYSCCYECDFYDIKYGKSINVIIINRDQEFHETIVIHPMNSFRRIYYLVSKKLKVSISSINLELRIKGNSMGIIDPKNSICSLPFNLNFAYSLFVIYKQDRLFKDYEIEEISPTFIESFQNHFQSSWLCKSNSTVLCSVASFFGITKEYDSHKLHCIPSKELPWYLSFNQNIDYISFEEIVEIFRVLNLNNLDSISNMIIYERLIRINTKFFFIQNMYVLYLIESKSEVLRNIFAHFAELSCTSTIFTNLMIDGGKIENRSNTNELFQIVKSLIVPSDSFSFFFQDLIQYENDYFSSIDYTFIGLLSLIPKSISNLSIVIERLFAPPNIYQNNRPFLHTEESRASAFLFIMENSSYDMICSYMNSLFVKKVPISNDFTNKMRNGIRNMGATCYMASLVQSLNSLKNFSIGLLSAPTNKLSPFSLCLRKIFAQLRYVRGKTVSIQPLIEFFKDISPNVQQDASEILMMILNKMHEENDKEYDITTLLQGEMDIIMTSDGRDLSSRKEPFFHLSIPTKNIYSFSDSISKCFAEELIDDYTDINGTKCVAYRNVSVSKWPTYLIIQLQRWEYPLGTMRRSKLEHFFSFPMILLGSELPHNSAATVCPHDYLLSSVVVHRGNAEVGHYFSIVEGDDGEWYLCNDLQIDYFSQSDIPNWSFGVQDDDGIIDTGYLLFYRKRVMDDYNPCIPKDLNQWIDRSIMKYWPSVVFSSYQFIDFVYEITKSNESNIVYEIMLNVFFKILPFHEEICNKWEPLIREKTKSSKEKMVKFLEYIPSGIGRQLPKVFSISHSLYGDLIYDILILEGSTTKYFKAILNCFGCEYSWRTIKFIFSIIRAMLQNSEVDWTSEEGTLNIVVCFFKQEISGENFKLVSSDLKKVVDLLCSQFEIIYSEKGFVQLIKDFIFSPNITHISRKCKKLESLTNILSQIAKDFPNIIEGDSQLSKILKPYMRNVPPQEEMPVTLKTEAPKKAVEYTLPIIKPIVQNNAPPAPQIMMGYQQPNYYYQNPFYQPMMYYYNPYPLYEYQNPYSQYYQPNMVPKIVPQAPPPAPPNPQVTTKVFKKPTNVNNRL